MDRRNNRRFDIEWSMMVRAEGRLAIQATAVNMSLTGLQFQTEQSFHVDREVEIELTLRNTQSIQCRVRITWQRDRGSSTYVHGARFVNLSQPDQKLLASLLMERYLEDTLREQVLHNQTVARAK